MADFIWHWTKGDKKFFTKKPDVVVKAMKEGTLVHVIKEKPRVFKK